LVPGGSEFSSLNQVPVSRRVRLSILSPSVDELTLRYTITIYVSYLLIPI